MNPLDVAVQLLDKLKLIIGHLVLFLKLVKLELESANRNLKQLVLALAVHSAILVELVLRLLVIILLFPHLDFLSKFLFGFFELLRLTS